MDPTTRERAEQWLSLADKHHPDARMAYIDIDLVRALLAQLAAAEEERDSARAAALLEVQFVAYALLGYEPDQKFILRDDAKESVEGVLELVKEAARAPQ